MEAQLRTEPAAASAGVVETEPKQALAAALAAALDEMGFRESAAALRREGAALPVCGGVSESVAVSTDHSQRVQKRQASPECDVLNEQTEADGGRKPEDCAPRTLPSAMDGTLPEFVTASSVRRSFDRSDWIHVLQAMRARGASRTACAAASASSSGGRSGLLTFDSAVAGDLCQFVLIRELAFTHHQAVAAVPGLHGGEPVHRGEDVASQIRSVADAWSILAGDDSSPASRDVDGEPADTGLSAVIGGLSVLPLGGIGGAPNAAGALSRGSISLHHASDGGSTGSALAAEASASLGTASSRVDDGGLSLWRGRGSAGSAAWRRGSIWAGDQPDGDDDEDACSGEGGGGGGEGRGRGPGVGLRGALAALGLPAALATARDRGDVVGALAEERDRTVCALLADSAPAARALLQPGQAWAPARRRECVVQLLRSAGGTLPVYDDGTVSLGAALRAPVGLGAALMRAGASCLTGRIRRGGGDEAGDEGNGGARTTTWAALPQDRLCRVAGSSSVALPVWVSSPWLGPGAAACDAPETVPEVWSVTAGVVPASGRAACEARADEGPSGGSDSVSVIASGVSSGHIRVWGLRLELRAAAPSAGRSEAAERTPGRAALQVAGESGVSEVMAHHGGVTCVALADDPALPAELLGAGWRSSRLLVSGGLDGAVRLWRVAVGGGQAPAVAVTALAERAMVSLTRVSSLAWLPGCRVAVAAFESGVVEALFVSATRREAGNPFPAPEAHPGTSGAAPSPARPHRGREESGAAAAAAAAAGGSSRSAGTEESLQAQLAVADGLADAALSPAASEEADAPTALVDVSLVPAQLLSRPELAVATVGRLSRLVEWLAWLRRRSRDPVSRCRLQARMLSALRDQASGCVLAVALDGSGREADAAWMPLCRLAQWSVRSALRAEASALLPGAAAGAPGPSAEELRRWMPPPGPPQLDAPELRVMHDAAAHPTSLLPLPLTAASAPRRSLGRSLVLAACGGSPLAVLAAGEDTGAAAAARGSAARRHGCPRPSAPGSLLPGAPPPRSPQSPEPARSRWALRLQGEAVIDTATLWDPLPRRGGARDDAAERRQTVQELTAKALSLDDEAADAALPAGSLLLATGCQSGAGVAWRVLVDAGGGGGRAVGGEVRTANEQDEGSGSTPSWGHSSGVNSVAWLEHEQGPLLVTASDDGAVAVWQSNAVTL